MSKFLYSHGLDINIAKLFNAIGAGCVLHIQLMTADNLDTADIMRQIICIRLRKAGMRIIYNRLRVPVIGTSGKLYLG